MDHPSLCFSMSMSHGIHATGTFTYIWLMFKVNVGRPYISIHGSYGCDTYHVKTQQAQPAPVTGGSQLFWLNKVLGNSCDSQRCGPMESCHVSSGPHLGFFSFKDFRSFLENWGPTDSLHLTCAHICFLKSSHTKKLELNEVFWAMTPL